MAQREVTFTVQGDRLLRRTRLADGREYVHACTRPVLEQVALYLEDHAEAGPTAAGVHRELPGAPFTQVQAAVEFLIDCGCVARVRSKLRPQETRFLEDAMERFHYLAHLGEATP
jgi:hypothetical protein